MTTMAKQQESETERRAALRECMEEMAGIAGRNLSEPAMRAYWRVLKRFDAATVRVAFDRAIGEASGWVWPGTIRAHAMAIQPQVLGHASKTNYTPPTDEQVAEMRRELADFQRKWAAQMSGR